MQRFGFFLFLMAAVFIFASEFNLTDEEISKMKQKYKNYAKSDYNLSRIEKEIKIDKNNFNTDVLKSIWSGNKNDSKQKDNYFKVLIEEEKETTTLFYFTSMSMKSSSWNNFFLSASKLENIRAFAVLRGYERDTKSIISKDLNKTFISNKIPVRFKVHPYMYKELNITKVPTYVIAKCKGNRFAFRKCKYLYRVDGDITLSRFFEILGDKNDSYQNYYNKLINM